MLLLLVADVLRLTQVTHVGLAAGHPTCHPPLRGLVSPQDMVLSPSTGGCIKQRMVQNQFSLVHKSLHPSGPEITHTVLILASGGSSRQNKDSFFPSALRGTVAIVGGAGGLASAFKPHLRCGAPSGMVLLVANVLRLTQVTHAGLAAGDPICHPPSRALVSKKSLMSIRRHTRVLAHGEG